MLSAVEWRLKDREEKDTTWSTPAWPHGTDIQYEDEDDAQNPVKSGGGGTKHK